jgi:hypothetical protein
MDDGELVNAALRATGLSAKEFAQRVVLQSLSTVRVWLKGAAVLPVDTRRHLEWLLSLSPSERLVHLNGMDVTQPAGRAAVASPQAIVLVWGALIRVVREPELLATIVPEGRGATEEIDFDYRRVPLYLLRDGENCGVLGASELPSEDAIHLAARELFGSTTAPRLERIKRRAAGGKATKRHASGWRVN